ncbi:MAG: hypothetical protein WDM78_06995 [Puia sp.]
MLGTRISTRFFMNPGQNNNHWITIQLEGVRSNRSAIGAHIELSFVEEGRKRTVYRDVNSGGSFVLLLFEKKLVSAKRTSLRIS